MRRFARDACGATSIEYAIIASMISIVIVAAVSTIGTKLSAVFISVTGSL